MDLKKNGIPSRRPKRTPKVEDNSWDCSVCTYRNTAEAFKCLMCDVRKGTSTRKPRINPQLVPNFNPSPPKLKKEKMDRKLDASSSQRRPRPKLKNVDRSSAQHKEVTVNNVTVIITEFKPKVKLSPNAEPVETLGSSTASESHSELSNDARNGESSDSRSS